MMSPKKRLNESSLRLRLRLNWTDKQSTDEDIKQLVQFFEILLEWDMEDRKKAMSDNGV